MIKFEDIHNMNMEDASDEIRILQLNMDDTKKSHLKYSRLLSLVKHQYEFYAKILEDKYMSYDEWFSIFEAECKMLNPNIEKVCKIGFIDEWREGLEPKEVAKSAVEEENK